MEARRARKQLQGSVSYAVREGRRGYGAEEEGTGHRLGGEPPPWALPLSHNEDISPGGFGEPVP